MVKAEQPGVGALAPAAVETETPPGPLYAFRLEPKAGPEDPNWDNAPSHGVVTVNALSAADARIVAAEAEVDFLDVDALPGDGTTTRHASAFRADKLYSVTRIGPADGPRGIMVREKDAGRKG